MRRLTSIEEFHALRRLIGARLRPEQPTIVIPAGTCGISSGAKDLIRIVEREILKRDFDGRVALRVTGCQGFCQMEPSILVLPQRVFYPRVSPEDVPRIVEATAEDTIVEDLLFVDPLTGRKIERQEDVPFFRKQQRLILAQHEEIDPLNISTYIARNGYTAFVEALERKTPTDILLEVKNSDLRGRGGAGFPTGLKWELLAAQPSQKGKFLVCNGDEGDPGAYMDRSILEGNPHSILEGMLLGAYATGATHGILYVRMEYPLAIKHLAAAIEQARKIGLLGERVLGTSTSFDVTLTKGAGAFVCGEETALIRSIEGKRGEPRQRPPFPIESGIQKRPTLINNVETWANIPLIVQHGASEYRKTGSPNNTGTKVFSLVGKVPNTGLIEVPMGTTIKEVVRDIGGASDSQVKAVQTGGPSGGCIPEHLFDLPIDYDSLKEAGAIMGSGGMIVMDHKTCMVDVAKYFMKFLQKESCGKCFTCREGTRRMHEILEDITNGKATVQHLDLLEELALAVRDTSMCGLGQTAPNPVLSTLRYFRDEYMEHIENRRCPAGVCGGLAGYRINSDCIGCGRCVAVCPTGAISGEKLKPHRIDPEKCIRCGACVDQCKVKAIETAPSEGDRS